MSTRDRAAEVLARWQYETYDSHFTMPHGLTWEAYKTDDPDGADALYLVPAHQMTDALAGAGLLAGAPEFYADMAAEGVRMAEALARGEALADRWAQEAATLGPFDQVYTDGVVAMLRAALRAQA